MAAAEVLRQEDQADFSIGRAYYAMFYAAEALLHENGFHPSAHGGVQSNFGQHFVKTGLFDAQYHRWLLDAFDRRLQGDRGFYVLLTDDEAGEMIAPAREFVAEVRRFPTRQDT